jgi:hypothetical protein
MNDLELIQIYKDGTPLYILYESLDFDRKLYAEYCGLKTISSIHSFVTRILKEFVEESGLIGIELDKKYVEKLLRFRLYIAGFYCENSLTDLMIGLRECYLVRPGVILFE